MKKYKYVIVSPKVYRGGPIVLHALCKYLNELGEDAKMFYLNRGYNDTNDIKVRLYSVFFTFCDVLLGALAKLMGKSLFKKYHEPPLKCRRKYLPLVGKNTIVVYPEINYGNFMQGKKVVRWLLYHNSVYKQEDNKTVGYDKNDLFFCYRDIFNDEKLNPEGRKLTITYFDLDTYKRTNLGSREGNCYIIRKGAFRDDLPKQFDGPIIDDLSEKDKVEIFNKCKYCISYDTQTAYSQIAALCGCISVVMPEKGKSREDYRKNSGSIFDTGFGEAFGFFEEELKYAKETSNKLIDLINKDREDAKSSVRDFIDECLKHFD